MDSNKPQFISVDVAQIVSDMIAFYQSQFLSITGVQCTLQPAQIERLIINMFAYRESLIRNSINEAACQNLPQFSTAPVLDYIAALFGVTRIPSQPAACQIEFELVGGHGNGNIPAGIRVASTDGAYTFQTVTQTDYTSGDSSVIVECEATQSGKGGNGYIAGTISTILDPLAAVSTAANIDTTASGTDDETDDSLRSRLLLASSAFSSAGPVGAYKFHAFSADASIVDVSVLSPSPGVVNIYPLVSGGITTPSNVLSAVLAACNDEKARPLTDTVNAISPTKIEYRVTVNATLYATADQTSTVQQISDKIAAYSALAAGTLGNDIEQPKFMGFANYPDGVYSADVIVEFHAYIPGFGSTWLVNDNIPVSDSQFAVNTNTTINVIGTV